MDNTQTQLMRDGFGKALEELGQEMPEVTALCADVTESTRVDTFAKKFPHRFFEMGVAEQNMVAAAAGMALESLVPFAVSYATFVPGRSFDQIRISVAYNKANVKLVGSHGGLTTGPDGATHQMLEDIAMMSTLPNMTVVVPADAREAYLATKAIARHNGPAYLRLSRAEVPSISDNSDFQIGRAAVLTKGEDVAIISCGIMTHYALTAAMRLKHEGIHASVINCHTIKPLDEATILQATKNVRGVVVAQEAQINGGLAGEVAQLLATSQPKPIRFVGVHDKFGQSGSAEELLKKYHLSSKDIVESSLKVFRRIHD